MDYNKIIIALAAVLIVMFVAGFFILNPGHAKTDSKVIVTSNSTLHDGDSFSIRLTDLNNTPIANQVVNITIVDANGNENHQQVTTDGSGNGTLQLNGLASANYTVNVSFGGNDNFTSCNATQKLEIKEKVTPSQQTSTISTDSSEASSSKRTYADMAHDSDAHTNPEKAKELNENIVGGKDGIYYFSDGSYVDMR